MELNVREEKLKGLFKQFQVEHNENCKTVFIDNNDEDLENYLNESSTVYLHMVDKEVRHLDLTKVHTIFVNKEYVCSSDGHPYERHERSGCRRTDFEKAYGCKDSFAYHVFR